jgi:hypothetical protein
MTEEEFVAILAPEEDYVHSGSKSPIFDGLVIMRKYLPNADIEWAGHEEVAGPDIKDLVKAGITEADILALRSHGWSIDEDETTVTHFT